MSSIRPARLPEDEPAILGFIRALQEHEASFEANRRLDPGFAADHWRVMRERAKDGVILIAEQDARPVGWALAHDDPGEMFMIASQRRHGFLAEIYVEPALRGRGYGRALITACEDWARTKGHSVMMIGVLAKNDRAIRAYEEAGYAPYNLILRRYL
jgi:GNAT superfamily N-acetyltransferase